ERPLVRVLASRTNRRIRLRVVNRGEKRELLRMIGVVITSHRHSWKQCPAQRIPDLEIALTAAYLPDVSPGRSGVISVRIIHPFADLVRGNRSIVGCAPENS